MLKSPALRVVLAAGGVVALLAVLRVESRHQDRAAHDVQVNGSSGLGHPREELTVGFLPVT